MAMSPRVLAITTCKRQVLHHMACILVQVNIVGFGMVEMAISTDSKPTIYRNLYEIEAQ